MKPCGIFAASLFGAFVAAAPVNKRDIVWVTETAVEVVTVPYTRTVWVSATPDSNAAFRPTFSRYTLSSSSTSAVDEPATTSSSVYVAPTTSSSSVEVAPTSTSVYVAPTTSSTSSSVYVAPTTSSTSVYVAPTTSSTSVYVAPTTTQAPTSTYVAPSTTTSSAAATTTSSSSGSGLAASGKSYTGDLTWYAVGLGACGWDNIASDHIVAISQTVFDNSQYATANPNNNPLCGRYVSITGVDGSQYQAKVVDRCTGCAEADLDLSEDFFNLVTSNGDGRVHDITWVWQ